MNDADQKRFVWALVLSWTPWIPILIGLGIAFANQKATGLAAVAGGIAELFVWWGLASVILCEAIAIVWLFRSFSRDRWLRNLVSGFSILLSGLMLLLVWLFVWVVWSQWHHAG